VEGERTLSVVEAEGNWPRQHRSLVGVATGPASGRW